jgi:hypothetical protein
MKRLVVTAIGLALLALPALAEASPHAADSSLIGQTTGTNGYVINVYGYRHEVVITASRDRDGASYEVHGTVSDEHLAADFGQFGALDLTFQPRGKARHPHVPGVPSGCHATLTVQPGVLRGSFSFHARNDETAADATEIPAKLSTSKFRCEDEPGGHVSIGHHVQGHHAVFLSASNSQGEFGTNFEAMRIEGRDSTYLNAGVAELIEGVEISSYISTRAPKNSFTYDIHKEVASVAPPAPFSGSAQLGQADNGVPTWTGDLAVDMPGYGVTPLTGPQFQAMLGRGSVVFFGSGSGTVSGTWSRFFTRPLSGAG